MTGIDPLRSLRLAPNDVAMTPRIAIFASALLAVSCSSPSPAENDYAVDTGNPAIDGFVKSVQRRDVSAVQAQIAEIGSVSGTYPQYKNASEYLDWVKDCRIFRVGRGGLDAEDNLVIVDASLKEGPMAARVFEPIYNVQWECPIGKFTQGLDAETRAPKIMMTEMRPLTRVEPSMRPPTK